MSSLWATGQRNRGLKAASPKFDAPQACERFGVEALACARQGWLDLSGLARVDEDVTQVLAIV